MSGTVRRYRLDEGRKNLVLVSEAGTVGRFLEGPFMGGDRVSVVVDGHLERMDGSLVPECNDCA